MDIFTERERHLFPRRYFIEDGRHVLIGLSPAETSEFELLEARAPLNADGTIAWEFEGAPQSDEERKWLLLYEKHDRVYNGCSFNLYEDREQLSSWKDSYPGEKQRGVAR
jgi:hypothetical protein